ncbi:MAG: hypothetical protein HYZ34_08145 [Ignavibacteriae bacterium]|nr:hypothetical protein [Ignavibacteriota bacterium]
MKRMIEMYQEKLTPRFIVGVIDNKKGSGFSHYSHGLKPILFFLFNPKLKFGVISMINQIRFLFQLVLTGY